MEKNEEQGFGLAEAFAGVLVGTLVLVGLFWFPVAFYDGGGVREFVELTLGYWAIGLLYWAWNADKWRRQNAQHRANLRILGEDQDQQ